MKFYENLMKKIPRLIEDRPWIKKEQVVDSDFGKDDLLN